jgi:hypothetical protein
MGAQSASTKGNLDLLVRCAMRWHIVLPVFFLAFLVVGLTQAEGQSSELWLGTWKINVEKSTYSPGPPSTQKSNVSTWESLGSGQFKNTTDIVDATGQSRRTEIILRFDGAEYPLDGAAVPTTRVYKLIDDRTFEFVAKVNGKVTTTNRSVVAPDGKTRTLTITTTNAQGQAVKNVVLYEKQ